MPTKEIFGRSINRPILFNKPFLTDNQTEQLLKHFSDKKSCLDDCIDEIARLDKKKKTCWPENCSVSSVCTRNIIY